MPPTDTSQSIAEQALERVGHLGTLPQMTMRIISLVEDPESTAGDLHDVVASDPVLGTRILKVVNSAFYGLSGEVSTLQRAIVLLGLNAVKNIAIAASLSKLFRGGKVCPNFDARQLWSHAVVTGAAGRLVSRKAGLHLDEEAFLAGLVHNVGILVEIQTNREGFAEAVRHSGQTDTPTLRLAESRHLGADHEAFGDALSRKWRFPQTLVMACGHHHEPWVLPSEANRLAMITHTADVLATCLLDENCCGAETDEINPQVLDALKLTQPMVDELMSELPKAREEASALFADAA